MVVDAYHLKNSLTIREIKLKNPLDEKVQWWNELPLARAEKLVAKVAADMMITPTEFWEKQTIEVALISRLYLAAKKKGLL
jgi:hypothetical protein